MRNSKIRVMIIDDSFIFRETMSRGLARDSGIEIVGTAPDASSAFSMVMELKPDVITVDVEMPGMNGIEFVRRLLLQYPVPVLMVSSINSCVFDAMSAGALDFVLKPGLSNMGVTDFLNELTAKIKIAASSNVGILKKTAANNIKPAFNYDNKVKVIAIGASTGGTEAILKVIQDMPVEMPAIVITQHIPPVFSKMFAERLDKLCSLKIKEAADGDELKRGIALIAPGDYHMTVARKGGKHIVECRQGEKVNGHCPSVDVLFDSVAQTFGDGAVGVILTGMGNDGARGLLNMKNKGAFTIGQDEKSSVVYGMPMEAYKLGAVTMQIPLDNIAGSIINRIST